MATDRNRALRALVPAAYAAAILLVLMPLADAVASTWPLLLSQYRWRYTAAGVLSGSLLMPLLGLLLAAQAAAVAGHRRVLTALGWASLLAAAGLALDLLFFTRDAPMIGRRLLDVARTVFIAGTLKTGMKLAFSTFGLVFLGFGALGAAREIAPTDPKGDDVKLGQVLLAARAMSVNRPEAVMDRQALAAPDSGRLDQD